MTRPPNARTPSEGPPAPDHEEWLWETVSAEFDEEAPPPSPEGSFADVDGTLADGIRSDVAALQLRLQALAAEGDHGVDLELALAHALNNRPTTERVHRGVTASRRPSPRRLPVAAALLAVLGGLGLWALRPERPDHSGVLTEVASDAAPGTTPIEDSGLATADQPPQLGNDAVGSPAPVSAEEAPKANSPSARSAATEDGLYTAILRAVCTLTPVGSNLCSHLTLAETTLVPPSAPDSATGNP